MICIWEIRVSAEKVLRLRERRRAKGLKETTIWLTQEADQTVSDLVASKGLKNRSEAIQYALSRIASSEEIQTRN